MKRSAVCSLGMVVLVLGLAAGETGGPDVKKAGYALLDKYVTAFQEMAATGTGGELEGRLRVMADDARKAKDEGGIDLIFFTRYSRLLAITALVVTPDKGSLLVPVAERELADFMRDVTGEEVIALRGANAVGQIARALAEEIINLQLYLDTLERREALKKDLYEGKPGPWKK
jgi:hypothetical protein